MFFKKKKKPAEEGAVKKIDKLIMGAIIGGAIASVLGLSIKSRRDKKEKQKHENENNFDDQE